MPENPRSALQDVRRRIDGGGRLLLDRLSDAELSAVRELMSEGRAEIINEACKPYVIKVLDT